MTTPLSAGGMIGPEASASEHSRMELQAKLNGLGGLNGRQLSPEAKEKKLREACQGFESIFIQKMWQEMRNAVPKTNLLTGREERFWQDMYDHELSKSMTTAGGIGLADMMYEQLSRNLVSASRTAAGGATGPAFVPTAAPLIPEEAPDQLAAPAPAAVYESEAPQSGAVAGAQPAANTVAAAAQAAPAAAAPQAEPIQTAALAEPVHKAADVAAIYGAAANASHSARGKIHAPDLGQSSGLINAQRARREAGDKLGSRAVRPAQNRTSRRAAQREVEPEAPVQTAAITQTGDLKPGSPEAIRAAVEMAKSGNAAPVQENGQIPDLKTLVANVQAKNTLAEQLAAAGQNQQMAQAEPVTRKVRRTTNIPQRGNSKPAAPKHGQIIRTLNVDNVGVNSKAGQGLKAYQAQKEQQAATLAAAETAPHAPYMNRQEPASAVVPPLTAAQSQPAAAENSAIPPLTAKTRNEAAHEAEISAIPPLTASRS